MKVKLLVENIYVLSRKSDAIELLWQGWSRSTVLRLMRRTSCWWLGRATCELPVPIWTTTQAEGTVVSCGLV